MSDDKTIVPPQGPNNQSGNLRNTPLLGQFQGIAISHRR